MYLLEHQGTGAIGIYFSDEPETLPNDARGRVVWGDDSFRLEEGYEQTLDEIDLEDNRAKQMAAFHSFWNNPTI